MVTTITTKKNKNLNYRACGDKQEKYENIAPAEIRCIQESNTGTKYDRQSAKYFKVQLEKGAKSTITNPTQAVNPPQAQSIRRKSKMLESGMRERRSTKWM